MEDWYREGAFEKRYLQCSSASELASPITIWFCLIHSVRESASSKFFFKRAMLAYTLAIIIWSFMSFKVESELGLWYSLLHMLYFPLFMFLNCLERWIAAACICNSASSLTWISSAALCSLRLCRKICKEISNYKSKLENKICCEI